MKNIIQAINKHKIPILLWLFIEIYIVYFSYLSILRYKTLYASYYDLGIMNQTVYNTYKSLKEKDPSLFLEMTDINSANQIKRMAIHNDILLAAIAPLYFIYSGPGTMLVLQTVVLAIGAFAVYKIADLILKDKRLSLIFAISYLLYPPMQKANLFDFHAVVLSTSMLLFMVYFYLTKKYRWSIVFFIASILSKEQVALTTAFFGLYMFFIRKNRQLALAITAVSFIWFILSVFAIIPYFRGSNHFALKYYQDIGSSLVRGDSLTYLSNLLGPLGFLSLLSPVRLLIALPEFLINLLSSSANMRNIYYHYSAVIQPFVFIAGIYGAKRLLNIKKRSIGIIAMYILIFSLIYSFYKSPLPFSKTAELHPFKYPQKPYKETAFWAEILKDDSIKISTTGHEAPLFSSRRYFYNFSRFYPASDYIIIHKTEVYNYPEKETLIPVYERLVKDKRFRLIYNNKGLEIYKKI